LTDNNEFKMTNEEKIFLQGITNLFQSDEKLYYTIGIDRNTGDRRMFLISMDEDQSAYLIAEIFNEYTNVSDYIRFESKEEDISLSYQQKRKWYHKILFWRS